MDHITHDDSHAAVKTTRLIRQSVIALVLRLLVVMVGLDLIYAVLIVFFIILDIPTTVAAATITFLWVIYMLKSVFQAYSLLQIVVTWARTLYYVTHHHLVAQTGILTINEQIFEMQQIRSVKSRQSWLGKIFDFGDVTIVFASSGFREEVVLRAIMSPVKYGEYFEGYLTEHTDEPDNLDYTAQPTEPKKQP